MAKFRIWWRLLLPWAVEGRTVLKDEWEHVDGLWKIPKGNNIQLSARARLVEIFGVPGGCEQQVPLEAPPAYTASA